MGYSFVNINNIFKVKVSRITKKLLYLKQKKSSIFLKGFSQLEKLINNFFVVKVGRINKKLLNIRKDSLSVSLTGFTLIELLIAISVFMLGIMGAFSLSLSNLNKSKENVNRVIAADLAREGIEIVRNIRDSNWLAREANADSDSGTSEIDIYEWDHGLDVGNFKVDYDNNNLISFSSMPVDLDSAIAVSEAKLYLNNGFYQHTAGQATIFSRAINLQMICLGGTPASPLEIMSTDGISCLGLEKIGLQIISRVSYTYGSQTNVIDAVEKIYNWRQ